MTGSPFTIVLVALAPAVPLALGLYLLIRPASGVAGKLAPWCAIPALMVAVSIAPTSPLELPWLLLGTVIGLDETAQVFLIFTSIVWLAAGIYARGYLNADPARARFFTNYLAAMSGNLGLIVAQDLLTFLLFFSLMSFAAFGLVIHDRSDRAWRAGRIYLIMVIVGEVLLFAALAVAANQADSLVFAEMRPALAASPYRDWVAYLAIAGFGIKLGLAGLHFWLPLAHPVAPTPASAVLSGAMIKAGLFGWLLVLPLGHAALPGPSDALIGLGIAAVFLAAAVGVSQVNPKTVLAYSSVSQMGLVSAGVGLGLASPGQWPEVLFGILLLAFHHAVAKSALFLSVGLATHPPSTPWARAALIAGLALAALSLAGAPLTSGEMVKIALKAEAEAAHLPAVDLFYAVLPWSGLATGLLMLRFLYLVWSVRKDKQGSASVPDMWVSWAGLLVVLAVLPFVALFHAEPGISEKWPGTSDLPMLGLASVLGGLSLWALGHRRLMKIHPVPAGDIIVPIEHAYAWLGKAFRRGTRISEGLRQRTFARMSCPDRLDNILRSVQAMETSWTASGVAFLMLILVLIWLAAL